MRIGWLSTGRDQAACNLLSEMIKRAQQDAYLELDLAVVFCDRERGESPESDRFPRPCAALWLPGRSRSRARSAGSRAQGSGPGPQSTPPPPPPPPSGVKSSMSRSSACWCSTLPPQRACPGGVHADRQFRDVPARYPGLNLHPALPQGPTGTWQQVIWQLMRRERRAKRRHDQPDDAGTRPRAGRRIRLLLAAPVQNGDPALESSYRRSSRRKSLEEIAAAEGEAGAALCRDPLPAAKSARSRFSTRRSGSSSSGKLQAMGNGAVFLGVGAFAAFDLTAPSSMRIWPPASSDGCRAKHASNPMNPAARQPPVRHRLRRAADAQRQRRRAGGGMSCPTAAPSSPCSSKYDDYLADVVRKPGYNAGNTLALIAPFLRAFGLDDCDRRSASVADTLLTVPGAADLVRRRAAS